MKRTYFFLITVLFTTLIFSAESFARVEWDVQKKLKLDTPPIDVAVSKNGEWLYILTDSGNILIYSAAGELKDRIKVGNHVDQIRVGSKENHLVLSSREDKTVEILTVEFIQQINITGSPFKGPADAPVVIAVFSDFQ